MNIARYIKVGIFFITLGTAGAGYIVFSTDGFNSFNTKAYELIMEDATGLSTNSKVYLAGVPVGKIREISLSDGNARITIAFLKDIEIRRDAILERKASSILGTSILSLSPGSPDEPVLPEGGRILPGSTARDMSALMGSAQEMSTEIILILRELQENQLHLLQTSLETFNAIALKLDNRSDAELDRLSRILESTAQITERVNALLETREQDIAKSATDIHIALENLRIITSDIRNGQGSVGMALQDEKLYAHLAETAAQAEIASRKLQQTLDSITRLADNADKVVTDAGDMVYKATGFTVQVDSAAHHYIQGGITQGGAALRLTPRSNKGWYQVGVTNDAELNAEIARHVGLFTLRGGLMDGSAGAGLNFTPNKWISLSGEVFRFTRQDYPNLQGRIRLYPFFNPASDKPWHWLYIDGGISDVLGNNTDFFIGAGIRFTDDDAQAVIPFVPLATR